MWLNSKNRYGYIAIIIHWLMAIIIIGLLALGIYMVELPISAEKLKLYGWHKEWGVVVFMLVIVRIFWRFFNSTPQLNSLSFLEKMAARFVHGCFYLLMVLIPLTGWLVSSSSGLPVSFFGWFLLPDWVSPNEEYRLLYSLFHQWLSYALIALIILHTLAALKHHFINKDDILRRMLPRIEE